MIPSSALAGSPSQAVLSRAQYGVSLYEDIIAITLFGNNCFDHIIFELNGVYRFVFTKSRTKCHPKKEIALTLDQ